MGVGWNALGHHDRLAPLHGRYLLLQRGKKSRAQSIVYGAMEIMAEKEQGREPLEIFMQALENAKPLLELKSRRVGGANYQIPVEVDRARSTGIALLPLDDMVNG